MQQQQQEERQWCTSCHFPIAPAGGAGEEEECLTTGNLLFGKRRQPKEQRIYPVEVDRDDTSVKTIQNLSEMRNKHEHEELIWNKFKKQEEKESGGQGEEEEEELPVERWVKSMSRHLKSIDVLLEKLRLNPPRPNEGVKGVMRRLALTGAHASALLKKDEDEDEQQQQQHQQDEDLLHV